MSSHVSAFPRGWTCSWTPMSHGLPDGERLRFFLRGDTVDAYHLVPEEAG